MDVLYNTHLMIHKWRSWMDVCGKARGHILTVMEGKAITGIETVMEHTGQRVDKHRWKRGGQGKSGGAVWGRGGGKDPFHVSLEVTFLSTCFRVHIQNYSIALPLRRILLWLIFMITYYAQLCIPQWKHYGQEQLGCKACLFGKPLISELSRKNLYSD